jgi:AcrR family transcriptional regulator
MVKPKKKGRYHHGDLRRALLDAALELVNEHGPHGFTMREAARRAGVSSGAPYKHFADHDALMREILIEGWDKMNADMEALMAVEQNATQRFRAMGIAHVVFAVRHPAYFRVMNMPEFADPGADPRIAARLEASQGWMLNLVTQARQREEIAMHEPLVVALAGQCLTYGLARLFVDGHLKQLGVEDDQAESLAIAVTEVLGLGLQPRHPPEKDGELPSLEQSEPLS